MVIIKCDFCSRTANVKDGFSTFVGIRENGWLEFKRSGSEKIEHACFNCGPQKDEVKDE